MLFAINPVETSPRNFTAFKTLAQAFNGTNTTGATGTPGSGSGDNTGNNNGASSIVINTALGMGSLFAIVAALL